MAGSIRRSKAGLLVEAAEQRRLERVKEIEPSSPASKIVGKLNDFNELCGKWQPKNHH
jgi:hypothetical protein